MDGYNFSPQVTTSWMRMFRRRRRRRLHRRSIGSDVTHAAIAVVIRHFFAILY
jgi:hypothetical protein